MGDRRKSLIPISDAHHDKGRASRLLTGNWDKKLFIYILFFTYNNQYSDPNVFIPFIFVKGLQYMYQNKYLIASIPFRWILIDCNWTWNIYKIVYTLLLLRRYYWGLSMFGNLCTKKVPCWEFSVCIRFFLQTNWIFLFPYDQVKTFYIFNLTALKMKSLV